MLLLLAGASTGLTATAFRRTAPPRRRGCAACCEPAVETVEGPVWEWLTACGGSFDGIAMGVDSSGLRGVTAARPLSYSADPLCVPVALGLSDSEIEFRETPLGQAVPEMIERTVRVCNEVEELRNDLSLKHSPCVWSACNEHVMRL